MTLKAKLTIGAEGIAVDFAGSSPASSYGINVPYTYTLAYASFGIRCIVGNKVPNNAGSLAKSTAKSSAPMCASPCRWWVIFTHWPPATKWAGGG